MGQKAMSALTGSPGISCAPVRPLASQKGTESAKTSRKNLTGDCIGNAWKDSCAAAAPGLERDGHGDKQEQAFQHHEGQWAGVLQGLLVPACSKHADQAHRKEEPAAECDENGPVPGLNTVGPDHCKARDEKEHARDRQRAGSGCHRAWAAQAGIRRRASRRGWGRPGRPLAWSPPQLSPGLDVAQPTLYKNRDRTASGHALLGIAAWMP